MAKETSAYAKVSHAWPSTMMKDLACGLGSGAVGVVVGYPFDTIKVVMQAGRAGASSPMHVMRGMIGREGLRGLYRGVGSPLLGVTAIKGVAFATNDAIKRTLADPQNPGAQLGLGRVLASGAISGGIVSLLNCPVDRVKIRLQVSRQSDAISHAGNGRGGVLRLPISVASSLVNEYGVVKALYRGYMPTLQRDTLMYATYFGGYEAAKRVLDPALPGASGLASALAGALAGCACWTIALPIDGVKSRIQAQSERKAARRGPLYTGMLDCAVKTWQAEGLVGFYRGWVPVMVRAAPTHAAIFATYNGLRLLLD